MTTSPPRGFARIDAIAAVGALVTLACLLLPVLGGGRGTAMRDVSANNLRIIQQGLVCYAVEWDDAQFSTAPEAWGDYDGDCEAYGQANGTYDGLVVQLGWGCFEPGECDPDYLVDFEACGDHGPVAWGYYSYGGNLCHRTVFEPIVFDEGSRHLGAFRFPNVSPVHDFVVPEGYGRFYDPVYYAPADTAAYEAAAPFFDQPCEYMVAQGPIPSSYVLSPAALFDPAVFRSPRDGGFQAPTSIPKGFRSPTLSQTLYPEQKTWIMLHHWLDDPPAACHPTLSLPFFDFTADCQPYLFNGGRDASPLAAFYDGSVQTVRAGDVELAEQRLRRQRGGQLWSRDTPMGEDGYFGDFAVDDVRVSHHILTTDGIRGRDWLGPQPRSAVPAWKNTGDQP